MFEQFNNYVDYVLLIKFEHFFRMVCLNERIQHRNRYLHIARKYRDRVNKSYNDPQLLMKNTLNSVCKAMGEEKKNQLSYPYRNLARSVLILLSNSLNTVKNH